MFDDRVLTIVDFVCQSACLGFEEAIDFIMLVT